MFVEFIDTGDSLREIGVTTNINERVKYTANTSITYMNSGPSTFALITGAGNGTLVKNITVKGAASTVKGMIYLYLTNNGGATLRLIDEIYIGNEIQSATQETFEVTYELDFYLASGVSMWSYYNTVQSLAITVQGLDMSY